MADVFAFAGLGNRSRSPPPGAVRGHTLAVADVLRAALLWTVTHSFYRLQIVGLEHVPKQGGALLVCNHLSYIDWFLVLAAQPRFIRFLVYAPYTNLWGVRHILRWAQVIPIDGSGGPRAILRALHAASEALARGELVAIFAEGTVSRTGFLLPFHRGFEQILKRTPVPIVPVCLDQVWGSIFSFHSGKFFWKLPHRNCPTPSAWPSARPCPAQAAQRSSARRSSSLSAAWSLRRSDELLPIHRRFVRVACRQPFRSCRLRYPAPRRA